MISCYLMGGLGNQLFQIFTVIAYSIEYKKPFYFLNTKTLGGGSNTTLRHTYWDNFLTNLSIFLKENINPQAVILREDGFTYKRLPSPQQIKADEIILYGYYQSYLYFEKYYSYIIKFLNLENIKKNILCKNNIDFNNLENTISIHFRYGDYKKVSHFHPLLTFTYYSNALGYLLQIIPKKETYIIYYFFEEEDRREVETIINSLRIQFKNIHFVRPNTYMEDYEEMLFMSCCNHNIIANSSFSWWGAYFNEWKDKIVCYPSVWFGESANNNTRDLCPKEWVCIPV